MRGQITLAIMVSNLCAIPIVAAQGGNPKTIYVDRNYRETDRERDAAYIVKTWETEDTVNFETWNRNPKGKIETGKYPKAKGFNLRNCYLYRYWPNGNLRSEGEMRNSWNEGKWFFYDEEGVLYSEIEFHEGLMEGQAIRYYPTGSWRMYTYSKNVKSGPSEYHDSSNKLISSCIYERDSMHGIALEYAPEGPLYRKTVYWHGNIFRDSLFYPNGKLFNSEMYDKEGKLHGRCWMFTPSGKISRYDEYLHGELLTNNCIHPLADADYIGDDCPMRLTPSKYPGGMDKFQEFVNLNQEYPEKAQEWHEQGVVYLKLHINWYGFVEEISQENIVPQGFGMEKESMRLLLNMKRFEPRRLNGKALADEFVIPFIFLYQQ